MKRKLWAALLALLIFIIPALPASAALSAGKLSVVSESGTVEVGQKSFVRLVYKGAGVDGVFAQLKYDPEIITEPRMTESVSGVEYEAADGVISLVYVNTDGNYPDDGAIRLCRLDFEVKDGASTGKTLGFEFVSASAALKTGNIASTAELETEVAASVVTPGTKDGRLAAVEVKGGRITPEFSPYIRNYSVVIPSSLGIVTINAVAQNPEATIEGDGSVSTYNRKRVVTVKNPNGDTFDYYFNISFDDYHSYSKTAAWKFIEKSGIYFAGALTAGFAGFAAYSAFRRRKEGEAVEK